MKLDMHDLTKASLLFLALKINPKVKGDNRIKDKVDRPSDDVLVTNRPRTLAERLSEENGAEEVHFSLDLIVRLLTIFFSLGREGFPRFHSEIETCLLPHST
jgi:hypothetical protein